MPISLPERELLKKTSDVDYFHWNYQFPINYIQKMRFRAIVDMIDGGVADRLLEVGTGSGIFLLELSKHCKELYAIDNHDNMDIVGDTCRQMGLKCNLRKESIEKTSFQDGFFDMIVAVSVLEFVDNLQGALDEIKRILKPGGSLLTLCPQESQAADFVLKKISRRAPKHEFVQSRKSVYRILEDNFSICTKKIFPPILGKFFPVYYFYKFIR